MLTVYGLKTQKGKVIRMAQQGDEQFNELVQEFVRGVNNLMIARQPNEVQQRPLDSAKKTRKAVDAEPNFR